MHTSVRHAFGLAVETAFPLEELAPAPAGSGLPSVSLLLVEPEAIERRFSAGLGMTLWSTVMDDRPVAIERGPDGEHRVGYGNDASFWISPRAEVVLCAGPNPAGPGWRRFLLDTVLFTVALLRGLEALHASAIATESGVVAFLGEQGGGKTSLAAELVRRGHPLFCDDILTLSREADGIVAHPGPPLMNVPPAAFADDLGHAIAELDGEAWMRVDSASDHPAPVAALCLLSRLPGAATSLLPVGGSVIDLLPHVLGLAPSQARRRARFELLSELASTTPILRLEADRTLPAQALGDLLGAVVDRPLTAAVAG